jgi:hypothetical protein
MARTHCVQRVQGFIGRNVVAGSGQRSLNLVEGKRPLIRKQDEREGEGQIDLGDMCHRDESMILRE